MRFPFLLCFPHLLEKGLAGDLRLYKIQQASPPVERTQSHLRLPLFQLNPAQQPTHHCPNTLYAANFPSCATYFDSPSTYFSRRIG